MGKFQNILKDLRNSYGLTQDGLAKKLKLSRSTVGMYESGAREPDFGTLELIADFFNVDTDYLLGRTPKTTYIPFGKQRSDDEETLISSYRELNPVNKKKSVTYTKNLLSAQQMEEELLAAHVRTDIEATPEGIQSDLDIMKDDSLWD